MPHTLNYLIIPINYPFFQVSIVSFSPVGCGKYQHGYSTLIPTVLSYINDILANGGETPSPTPTPTPTLIPTPSPSPSPSPSSSPPPFSCSLDTSTGVIISLTVSGSGCNAELWHAVALAANDVSGARRYCYTVKCNRTTLA